MTEKKAPLLSPAAICAFAFLLKPQQPRKASDDPKFTVTLIFDKEAQATPEFAAMREAVKDAITREWGAKPPAKLNSPFRDSADGADWGFPADCLFVRASTKEKPGVLVGARKDFDSTEIYSGMKGRASLTVYTYDVDGNRGVSFGLSNFQKLDDGPRMAGRASAESDFGVTAEDAQVDLDALLNA